MCIHGRDEFTLTFAIHDTGMCVYGIQSAEECDHAGLDSVNPISPQNSSHCSGKCCPGLREYTKGEGRHGVCLHLQNMAPPTRCGSPCNSLLLSYSLSQLSLSSLPPSPSSSPYLGPELLDSIPHSGPLLRGQSSRGNPLKLRHS